MTYGFYAGGAANYVEALWDDFLLKKQRIQVELAKEGLDPDRRQELQQQIAELKKEYRQMEKDIKYCLF